ncbi:SpdD protein [Streptomyces sp. DSM 110735]|uniref:SpdD protein n=1 Tax=Streptomyces sp. DSM 110735 TaxID=2775031 RepID=UPI0018F751A8|nr:SpdD protein [Streptomyces sp. DSM 110735]MBJ7907374.1 SpdD protein [Streptomyces sp. DSM 110735]
MFTPKYPPTDTAPVVPAPAPTVSASTPATTTPTPVVPASAPASNRPVVQLTPGSTLALVGGGTAVVLVVGAVLVSMLLAVAITGVSVAICAVVLRSLVKDSHNHR